MNFLDAVKTILSSTYPIRLVNVPPSGDCIVISEDALDGVFGGIDPLSKSDRQVTLSFFVRIKEKTGVYSEIMNLLESFHYTLLSKTGSNLGGFHIISVGEPTIIPAGVDSDGFFKASMRVQIVYQ